MTIRAVLWDIDDTIFDYATADTAGMRGHLAAEGLLEGFGSVEAALDRWRELTVLHWRRFEREGGDFLDQRRDRVRDFLGRPELTPDEADAWFDRYVVHYEAAWALFPDTVPVLDLLARDYRHAVLSNSSIRNQERKLRILGIRDRFEAVLCAAELGVAKPAPEAFHAACTALGLPRTRWRTSGTSRTSTPGARRRLGSWGSGWTARTAAAGPSCTGSRS